MSSFTFNDKDGIILPFSVYDPIKKESHELKGLLDTGFTGLCGFSSDLANSLGLTEFVAEEWGFEVGPCQEITLGNQHIIKRKLYFGQIVFLGEQIKNDMFVVVADGLETVLGMRFINDVEKDIFISNHTISFQERNRK